MREKLSPPYYAVIFTNQRTEAEPEAYARAAERMVELANNQPGFLGVDSVRDASGTGITISYWSNLEAIEAWRNHPEHLHAQSEGRANWYREYDLHVAKVERHQRFCRKDDS